jgi:transglutaminase-like putative cysteine protease
MVIRYGAAYASTLIAIGAAATLPNLSRPFVWLLFAITLLGLPVSLSLRFSGPRVGGYRLPRFLLALIVTIINVVAILFLVVGPLQKRIGASLLSSDFFRAFFFHHDADDAILIVLQVIALIMVCRCLVVITDKDAVLCTVPAFCILVLLIVVERQPGVVAFFVLWAAMAGVLFALDQRQELARHASAFVPAFMPGQSTALSARTLGGVMAFSLLCAGILSYTVTSRIENRSMAESWISSLAMQLTQFATALPETSVNAGPERQIDFTSGPALPTRSPLWTMIAQDLRTGQTVTPAYWRMFTLANYNGTSWLQAEGQIRRVSLKVLGDVGLVRPLPLRLDRNPGDMSARRRRERGFDLASVDNDKKSSPRLPFFGSPTRTLRVQAIARQANIGFVPHLPAMRYLTMLRANPDYLTAYPDHSVDVRFVEPRQLITMVCEVPSGEEFGVPGDGPPRTAAQRPNSRARLSLAERRIYLQLPASKLERVRRFAKNNLARLPANASDYAKAAHLAEVLRKHAAYTLRPPALPQGRDATDYFLFESRKGYCTYFAGALAVLCRSVGIPARVASGFTLGERQQESYSYLVRESNAHAWTEVWVPNWGWATLDATPADERGDNAGDWWTGWADAFGSVLEGAKVWLIRHITLIGALLIALGLSGFVFYHERTTLPARRLASLRFKRRVSDKAARREVDEVYERAVHLLQKRFRARASWETPHEWLQSATATLRLKNPAPLQHLTDLYVQAQYSAHELGADESHTAWRALNEISWETEK